MSLFSYSKKVGCATNFLAHITNSLGWVEKTVPHIGQAQTPLIGLYLLISLSKNRTLTSFDSQTVQDGLLILSTPYRLSAFRTILLWRNAFLKRKLSRGFLEPWAGLNDSPPKFIRRELYYPRLILVTKSKSFLVTPSITVNIILSIGKQPNRLLN